MNSPHSPLRGLRGSFLCGLRVNQIALVSREDREGAKIAKASA
jgi:hypothetical protein